MKFKLFAVTIIILLTVQYVWAHENKMGGSVVTSKQILIKQLAKGDDYQPLLEGGKNSVRMEAGRVVKLRGQKGSPHSTKNYEEILIVLKGKGSVTIGEKDYPIKAGEVLYIPPHQNHQITNNDSRKLEYIYVASPAFGK